MQFRIIIISFIILAGHGSCQNISSQLIDFLLIGNAGQLHGQITKVDPGKKDVVYEKANLLWFFYWYTSVQKKSTVYNENIGNEFYKVLFELAPVKGEIDKKYLMRSLEKSRLFGGNVATPSQLQAIHDLSGFPIEKEDFVSDEKFANLTEKFAKFVVQHQRDRARGQ